MARERESAQTPPMVKNDRRLGYWPGIRHPAATISFRLPSCPQADFRALDAWLADTFGLETDGESRSVPGQVADTAILALAWRVLELAAFFQREARIPIFETGRIIRIVPDAAAPRMWLVVAQVPCLDVMPGDFVPGTLRAATMLLLRAIRAIPAASNMESLYQALDRDVIKPLARLSMSGISTQPILFGTYHQGIPYRHLGAGIYQLGWGENARLLARSAADSDSAIGSTVSCDKYLTAQFLRAAGLPAPVHCLVGDEAAAERAARELGWPLVIKPADRERSEGVTVSISDSEKLLEGYRQAAALSKRILVERQVQGTCYRLMIANSTFLYAVRRLPKAVIGDGVLTVARLIDRAGVEAMRLPAWKRGKRIELDALCCEALAAQGKTSDSVPAVGKRVSLRMIESTEWGGDVENATDDVHPDNIDVAVRAARVLGLTNAGVDIITPDVTQPWHVNGAIINEVNYSPHFGGTTTAKGKMPIFLKGFIRGDGRIPVEVFVGGKAAIQAARKRHAELLASGIAGFVTGHGKTFDQTGKLLPMGTDSVFERGLALLMRRDVATLLLVVQTDELLSTGLPVDKIVKLHCCGGPITCLGNPGSPDPRVQTRLIRLLRSYLPPER